MPRSRVPGRLITFEGTEGAGKSTLIRALETALRRHFEARGLAHELVLTREPGGSAIAERIREVLLAGPSGGEAMDPWCELFLYEAARAEHLARTVLPALARGAWVLCDRFADSSLAYQAQARGLPWSDVQRANRLATRGLKPDLTVFLDVDPAVGLGRASEKNRFEAEGVAFQEKVRRGFLRARKEDPRRWLTLRDRGATPEENAGKALRALLRRFGEG